MQVNWIDRYCVAHEVAVRLDPAFQDRPQDQINLLVGRVMDRCEPDILLDLDLTTVGWLRLLPFKGNKSLPVVYLAELPILNSA